VECGRERELNIISRVEREKRELTGLLIKIWLQRGKSGGKADARPAIQMGNT